MINTEREKIRSIYIPDCPYCQTATAEYFGYASVKIIDKVKGYRTYRCKSCQKCWNCEEENGGKHRPSTTLVRV